MPEPLVQLAGSAPPIDIESGHECLQDEQDEASSTSSQTYWDPSEDRRPAKVLPVGTVLAWSVPSVFNASSLFSVLFKAPISHEQLVPVDSDDEGDWLFILTSRHSRNELLSRSVFADVSADE